MARRYAYWVNYGIKSRSGWGEGSLEVLMPHPLLRGDQVAALGRDIAAQQSEPMSVVVRTFQLLREE